MEKNAPHRDHNIATRLLPQSMDAEQGVLGSFLLFPRAVGDLCVEKNVTPAHFHHPTHAGIFEVLIQMLGESRLIDLVTVTQLLRDKNILDQCGGPAFIAELSRLLPTAANASYYIDIVQEKYTLRQVITTCTEYAARSYEEQENVPLILDELETSILSIRKVEAHTAEDNKTLALDVLDRIEKLYESRGAISGIPTGFADLDRLIDGLQAPDVIVIAARPSMGKTALAMNIVEHIGFELRKPIAVFSLEMGSRQLVMRLACSRARVNLSRLRDGFASERDFANLQNALRQFRESPVIIDDASGITIAQLRARARRYKQKKKIELVVIDYLQLLKGTSRRSSEHRESEITEISNGIKAMAKELGLPVIVLAQLNRAPEKRGDGRPKLSDLRESGSIEQDADIVGLLYRAEEYAPDDDIKEALRGKADLIIAKHRNGATHDGIPLTFIKEFTRFEDRAREIQNSSAPDPATSRRHRAIFPARNVLNSFKVVRHFQPNERKTKWFQ